MRDESARRFAEDVIATYRGLRSADFAREAKSLYASEVSDMAQPLGHPDFADLALGESAHCNAVAMFLDLRDFTGRTFWEGPEVTVNLSRAVLTQVVEVVADFGGHALGLRGDGVFVCFGGRRTQDDPFQALLALSAGAFALDATQNALNGLLVMQGLEPVQLRAGADFGRLDFVRTGTADGSEVNVIGFAANFAAKCEKYAKSWELVVGQELAALLPDSGIFTPHERSPKRYQRDLETRTYPFYQVAWRGLIPDLAGVREALAGTPSSLVRRV